YRPLSCERSRMTVSHSPLTRGRSSLTSSTVNKIFSDIASSLVLRPAHRDPATAPRRPRREALRRRATGRNSRSWNEAHGDGSASWCGQDVPVGALVSEARVLVGVPRDRGRRLIELVDQRLVRKRQPAATRARE